MPIKNMFCGKCWVFHSTDGHLTRECYNTLVNGVQRMRRDEFVWAGGGNGKEVVTV